VGRPNVLSDSQREEALSMLIRGSSHRKVAETFGIGTATVYDLMQQERGRLSARVERTVQEVLMELALLREEAWESYFHSDRTLTDLNVKETFGANGDEENEGAPISECVQKVVTKARRARLKDPRWLLVVQGCIDHEVKIRGLSAPLTTRHELRWAGVDPSKIQNDMVRLLAQRVMEMRSNQQQGVQGYVEQSQGGSTSRPADGSTGPSPGAGDAGDSGDAGPPGP